jgi:hypothetical protein
MHFDVEASGHRRTFQHSREASDCERCPSLREKHERGRWRLAVKATQCSHFPAGQGMRAGSAVLRPTNVQDGLIEINLIPMQVAKLRCTQAVPEGD